MGHPRWWALAPWLLVSACGGSTSSVGEPTEITARCGDVEGAWSAPVDGLRGRLVTSGSRDDGSSLRVFVELENVGGEPLAIHWDGRADLGFVRFRLDDAAGVEVPEPDWALGGNEPGGSLAAELAPDARVRHPLGEVIARVSGERILRIGAFWARPLPRDGSRRFLVGTLTGREARPDDLAVRPGDDGLVVGGAIADPEVRAWRGPLELPGVCVD